MKTIWNTHVGVEVKIFGRHDEKTLKQIYTCEGVGDVRGAVLCADGHFGYAMPIGGVVALKDMISLSGVGFDIGCGNMAVKTDMVWKDVEHRIPQIARNIRQKISFGIGRKNNAPVEHPIFDDRDAFVAADVLHLRELAQSQLGTVGSGNHYIDLFREVPADRATWHPGDEDPVWIGVHFGSRGLGHKSTVKYLELAGGQDGMDVPPVVLSLKDEMGQRYYEAVKLGGRYAHAGREWVVDQVRRILCAKVLDSVHNHHNYAWEENHGGEDLIVVRKGATPAFPGQRGFVGGSMGDEAVILEGVESDLSREALYSTVHGAGRVMGRMEAKGKKDKKTGEWKRMPRIDRDEMEAWLKLRGVTRVGGDLDEAPLAYRRLTDVLQAHQGTIRVTHTLQPFLVLMADSSERDPYKD
jgi:tRNA-splicing ligase RtcB